MNNPHYRTAILNVFDQSNLMVRFQKTDEFPQLFPSFDVSMSTVMLGTRILATLTDLTEVAEDQVWDDLENPFAPAQSKGQEISLMDCLEKVITEGSSLFSDLCSKGLKPILDEIDKLPDDSRLQINTDCAFLPWEILYPLNFHRERDEKNSGNFRPQRLWGNRFHIEVLYADRLKPYKYPFRLE